ncbi:MAG: rhomboid family intramembrane serine protease [Flavobacteriales bacterium]|nr:rhomboid family intramembrane serine protease [Flavobacteriales bacterium]MBP6697064.1 rhomboid family intramembrane serine protease [Flavobacteriales bacterium]
MGPASEVPVDPQRRRMWSAAVFPALAILLLWLVHIMGEAYGLPLYRLGVLPREASGIVGIFTSPLIHGDYEHLFNNSLPILVLGWCLLYFYPRVAWRVLVGIWLFAGTWVWISARGDRHIGASGVIYGLAAFLFFSGLFRKRRALMAIALLVVFMYGGLIWGLLPIVPRMSWESHLWGGIAGVVLAWFYRKVEPAYLNDADIVLLDDDDTGPLDHASTTQQGAAIRIVYHADPGDEASDDELALKRKLDEGRQPLDPDRTDITWSDNRPIL